MVREFPRVGFFQQITWSPDGKRLLGVSNGFGTGWSVAALDIATGKVSALNREDCCTPDWSADGRSVIFSWRPPKNGAPGAWTQLWMIDVAGKERRLLYAEDGRHTYGGCFSPDGRYALFTGNAQEDGDPAQGGAPMQILHVADAPILGGDSPELRQQYPNAKVGPLLTLPSGWEPLWTVSESLAGALEASNNVEK
jgi:Tol biopolymer transport system component